MLAKCVNTFFCKLFFDANTQAVILEGIMTEANVIVEVVEESSGEGVFLL